MSSVDQCILIYGDRGIHLRLRATEQSSSIYLPLLYISLFISTHKHSGRKDSWNACIYLNIILHNVSSIFLYIYHCCIFLYLFIRRGANIDKHDKDSFSPLLLASCEGHADTIKVLLARGANPYEVDKNDKSCIYWAAEEDKLEALKVNYCFILRIKQG